MADITMNLNKEINTLVMINNEEGCATYRVTKSELDKEPKWEKIHEQKYVSEEHNGY